MRYILLASHGRLAEGMLHSVEMITGAQKDIWTLSAYVEEEVDLQLQINDVCDKLAETDELIIVSDIFGGSVNNEFMNRLGDKRIHLIAGMNLPLVIELVTLKNSAIATAELIEKALKNSKSSIKYCNPELAGDSEDEDF
ncbi:PTS sugar transporter subunit IIA [Bacillus rubiinfantis]|uniref:PTS sugar transporter subunit IIA n=1 Tax=Bacillus rubiinfantis TaxID=1499680 RepID=UPI000B202F26|nr:PTS sugar transporter subunit IIA [Bacillus rubiinfantis]